jgi:hypothetical protein
MRLVHRLQATGAGCQWMLIQWAELRALFERGVPWLAPEKLKASVCWANILSMPSTAWISPEFTSPAMCS